MKRRTTEIKYCMQIKPGIDIFESYYIKRKIFLKNYSEQCEKERSYKYERVNETLYIQ